MSEERLYKDCPFCLEYPGDNDITEEDHIRIVKAYYGDKWDGNFTIAIRCDNCGAVGPDFYSDVFEVALNGARELWNERKKR